MDYQTLHDWNVTPDQAIQIQFDLAARVRQESLQVEEVRLAAGSDLSFDRSQSRFDDSVTAGFVSLRLPEKTLFERSGVRTKAHFPYIPGLLSFREIPPLLEAWTHLTHRPDALIVDGQGLAHPRRFGLACHLGLLLDLPTVGVAKRLFVGAFDPVPEESGSWSALVHRGEIVGAALRTRVGVNPVFVSVGHRIDLPGAIALVIRCLNKTRLPETTRAAHAFVNDLRLDPEYPLIYPPIPAST
jgi:deoxyribonuclease V